MKLKKNFDAIVWRTCDDLDDTTIGVVHGDDVMINLGIVCNGNSIYYRTLSRFGFGYVVATSLVEPCMIESMKCGMLMQTTQQNFYLL
jgi:hypothetical protein